MSNSYFSCPPSLQGRLAWYYKNKVSNDTQLLANNHCNSTLIQKTVSFVCNFQNQNKLFVRTIFSVTVVTAHNTTYFKCTLFVLVLVNLLLAHGFYPDWNKHYFCQYFPFTNTVTFTLALDIPHWIAQKSPNQSDPQSVGKVIYDGSHDMGMLHSSQVSSLHSFIKKVSLSRINSFEQLCGSYVGDIFWTPVTARNILITCSVNSQWVSRQSLIPLTQQEKCSGVYAIGQANGIFHSSP